MVRDIVLSMGQVEKLCSPRVGTLHSSAGGAPTAQDHPSAFGSSNWLEPFEPLLGALTAYHSHPHNLSPRTPFLTTHRQWLEHPLLEPLLRVLIAVATSSTDLTLPAPCTCTGQAWGPRMPRSNHSLNLVRWGEAEEVNACLMKFGLKTTRKASAYNQMHPQLRRNRVLETRSRVEAGATSLPRKQPCNERTSLTCIPPSRPPPGSSAAPPAAPLPSMLMPATFWPPISAGAWYLPAHTHTHTGMHSNKEQGH